MLRPLIQLLPRSELDEFGLMLELIEYISDTFPLQTDVHRFDSDGLFFTMHNYTEVVAAILDAKLRKVFASDPRVLCKVEMAELFPNQAEIVILFPAKKYRTKKTLPVYRNFERYAKYTRNTWPDKYLSHVDFIDIGDMKDHVIAALRPVVTYHVEPVDVSRRLPSVATGSKKCKLKKR